MYCISLSKNKKFNIKIDPNNITNQHILNIIDEYSKQNTDLVSDFINDFFTHKTDKTQTFCCTKLVNIHNKKNAFYIAGNNDYFYQSDMAYKLNQRGYNFYAISFPNFAFVSNVHDPKFSSFDNINYLFRYIEIIIRYYKINKIDILFGHSTGALIATMYAEFKNVNELFIERLILSSPLFNFYLDPSSKSVLDTDEFVTYIVTPLGLIIPHKNLKSIIGTPNMTTCQEFNELCFNPRYKSLFEINMYASWIRSVRLAQLRVQKSKVNVNCKVDIFCSNQSIYWKYSENKDNTVNVDDIKKYGKLISQNVKIHEIPNSIHSCFLRINIQNYL